MKKHEINISSLWIGPTLLHTSESAPSHRMRSSWAWTHGSLHRPPHTHTRPVDFSKITFDLQRVCHNFLQRLQWNVRPFDCIKLQCFLQASEFDRNRLIFPLPAHVLCSQIPKNAHWWAAHRFDPPSVDIQTTAWAPVPSPTQRRMALPSSTRRLTQNKVMGVMGLKFRREGALPVETLKAILTLTKSPSAFIHPPVAPCARDSKRQPTNTLPGKISFLVYVLNNNCRHCRVWVTYL